jgi:cysteine desulfurase
MEPNGVIYLDNAATTRQNPSVTAVMNDIAENEYYNSHAPYSPSIGIKAKIERAKKVISDKLGVSGGELYFTSGATESNNIALLGKPRGGIRVINDQHASIVQTLKHVSNDFGILHTHTHLDATQIFCKIPFSTQGIDSISVSAHKIGGPKGIGALWVRSGVNLKPQMYGGGAVLRPGTENSPAIMGFAHAVELWDTEKNLAHVKNLREYLVVNLPAGCVVDKIHGEYDNPYITNITIPILGQTVMNAMELRGIIVGIGSACSSKENLLRKTVRVSFNPENTIDEIDTFLQELKKILVNYVAK